MALIAPPDFSGQGRFCCVGNGARQCSSVPGGVYGTNWWTAVYAGAFLGIPGKTRYNWNPAAGCPLYPIRQHGQKGIPNRRMDYRMIALDLDGTLTDSKKEIPEPTLHALLEIQKQGFTVVLASGRPTPGMTHLARKLHLEKYGGYLLSFNGASITDCSAGRIIFEQTIPKPFIPGLYSFAREHETGLMTYHGDKIITGTRIDKYMELEARINHMTFKAVKDFPGYVDFNVSKCLLTGEPEHMAEAEILLKEKYGSELSIYRSEPFFLEVMPMNIDKAYSLQILCGKIGLNKEQLISCGDGYNDLTMIRFAGLGVAMGNAQESVKSAADYVTASNDNNGILKVIEKFIWGNAPAPA